MLRSTGAGDHYVGRCARQGERWSSHPRQSDAAPCLTLFARPQFSATGLDACLARRNDSTLRIDAQTDVVSEIARLRAWIDREAAAVAETLNDRPSTPDDYTGGWVEHESCVGSSTLYTNTWCGRHPGVKIGRPCAQNSPRCCLLPRPCGPMQRPGGKRLKTSSKNSSGRKPQRAKSGTDWPLSATLMRRRDALQSTIDETAGRIAQGTGGDCRRTLPILGLVKPSPSVPLLS